MKDALIIFTRVPEPGKTKTRLEARFTKEECAKIHEAMIHDLWDLCNTKEWDTYVYYTPANGRERIQQLLPGACQYLPQEEIAFGERMKRSMGAILNEGYDSCVLVGTDIPVLSREVIREAFLKLQEKQVVIGATMDQGYYLIGMTALYGGIFDDQKYGTGSVYSDTVTKIIACGCEFDTLPVLRDIDEPEDIDAYWREFQKKEKDEIKHTWECLCELERFYGFEKE